MGTMNEILELWQADILWTQGFETPDYKYSLVKENSVYLTQLWSSNREYYYFELNYVDGDEKTFDFTVEATSKDRAILIASDYFASLFDGQGTHY